MASPRPRRSFALLAVLGVVAPLVPFVAADRSAAADAPAPPAVHERSVAVAEGALDHGATASLAVPGGPELIAISWAEAAPTTFSVRARDGHGWGDWYELDGGAVALPDGPDAGSAKAARGGSAGPAFLGHDLTDVQVRVTEGDPSGVVVHAIDSEPTQADEQATRADATTGAFTAMQVATPPTIRPRSQWGADESWRDDSGGECDGTPDYTDDIQLATVHHTDGSNTYTEADVPGILRGIYDYHVHSNGWCDIAYNFFVDRFGHLWEGRFGGITRPVIGGHTSGFNSVSTGVAVLGDFTTEAVPQAAYDALVQVLAFKLAYHGVDPKGSSNVTVGSNTSAKWPEGTPVTLQNIQGHSDSNKTDCPGTQLRNLLPQLRNDVAARIAQQGFQPAFTIGRISDVDRFSTAAALARSTFSSSATAYLARGDGPTSFADALAANYAAGLAGAPVLLTNSASLPASTASALQGLGVTTVHLLGGTDAISPAVESALQAKGLTVDRVAGADRYATAAAVAQTAGQGGVGTDDQGRRTAILSSGRNFPDALAAGGIVYGKHLPQLLSDKDALPGPTGTALTALGIQHVVITGGPEALSAAVQSAVEALGISVERVQGATRYDTAVALANLAIDRYGFAGTHADLATGEAFPDALTGGAHVGKAGAVLLLTAKSALPAVVTSFLQARSSVSSGDVFGGRSAVESLPKLQAEETIGS